MESTIPRSRNTRSSYGGRKRKTSINSKNRISAIIRQTIICMAIFVIIFTIKNVDSSITNYISIKTSNILKADSDINYLIDSTKKIFQSLNISNEKLKAVFGSSNPITKSDNEEVNLIPGEMNDKIYDWSQLIQLGFHNPINGVITSAFGNRISPITNQNEFHEGIDISPVGSDQIMAVLDGEVLETGNNASFGNYLKIKHNDLISVYAHAEKIVVKQGQKVAKGDLIAIAGNTGASVGKHLHFELWKDEKMVNPQKLFDLEVQEVDKK